MTPNKEESMKPKVSEWEKEFSILFTDNVLPKEFWEWYYEDETDEVVEDAIERTTCVKDERGEE